MSVIKYLSFLIILQLSFTVFASNIEESTSSNSLTPIQRISKQLIEDLDRLGSLSLKTKDKISLAKKIQADFVESAPLLSNDFSILQKITSHHQYETIKQYINASLNNLKLVSEEYFRHHYAKNGFTTEKVNFLNKNDGDQTGARMIISLVKNDTEEKLDKTYYIKTHQEGSQGNRTSSSILDPKEVFIYKLFELIKVGPKAHFFSSHLSGTGVYIATQDAGFTKKTNKRSTTSFETFDKFTQDYVQNVLASSTHKQLSPEQKEIIDKDKLLLKNISTADLLARIFRLTDLTTNLSNYGFKIKAEEPRRKLKVIDFRVVTDASYSPPGLYEGFKEGNGLFNYAFNNLLLYILKERNLENRKAIAKEILEELESRRELPSKIEEALSFTKLFCQDSQIGVSSKILKNDLETYALQTLNNFNNLKISAASD
ncbi:MAG: hypothetical protein ACRYGR_10615 [Janthinobacterium lividum]